MIYECMKVVKGVKAVKGMTVLVSTGVHMCVFEVKIGHVCK